MYFEKISRHWLLIRSLGPTACNNVIILSLKAILTIPILILTLISMAGSMYKTNEKRLARSNKKLQRCVLGIILRAAFHYNGNKKDHIWRLTNCSFFKSTNETIVFAPNGVFYFQISFSFQISLAFQNHSNLECVGYVCVFPHVFFLVVCLWNELINRMFRWVW